MENPNKIPLLQKIALLISLWGIIQTAYSLYWNGTTEFLLPFAGEGVQEVSLFIPPDKKIAVSFVYKSNSLVLQPLGFLPQPADAVLTLLYPWKSVSYQLKLQPKMPEITTLYTSPLGRGKSGLVIYEVKAYAPYQTWIEDSTGLRYYAITTNGKWISLIGWPLTATKYSLRIVVQDAAQNYTTSPLTFQPIKPSYRLRVIPLTTDFAKNQGQEVGLTNLTGDPNKDYEKLMAEFARQTKVSIFDLTYRIPRFNEFWITNAVIMPLSQYEPSSLFGDERRFVLNGKTIRSSYHYGIDLVAPPQSPILAPWKGKILFADYNGASGNTILIDHGLGLYSIYMHLNSIAVSKGDIVNRGDTLGIIGKSGYSTGIHLHFGISIQGRYVDPTDWTNASWIEESILKPLQTYL